MATALVDDEYNLQEAWDKACLSFAETTKVNLTEKPKFSIDEVLDRIREKQTEDSEKDSKYKVAKDVISKTLNFVMVLGGIAAEGASMVFAPSSLCFNAIAYLIDTGAKYKRIFSSLSDLFSRISDVLERCKIYLRLPAKAVDVALRKIINEELVCFVDICALSIKVLKTNKVLIALKVFAFDSDEGVSEQLGRLATLVERESQMRATLGFESQKTSEKNIIETRDGTKRINMGVDKLLVSERKKEADSAAKRLLAKIDSSLGNPGDAFKTVSETLGQILSEQIQGTGEWLRKDPLFKAWESPEHSPFSVFGISGDEGYGKSFLFATVVQYLQELHADSQDDMTYTSTAYYIFDEKKDRTSLVRALKVLAWQVANKDVVYRKDLSSVKATGINQVGSLWETLFSKSYKSDSTFFLLLDGVDLADKPELKEFIHLLAELHASSTGWPRFKLRILLSGRPETMNKIQTYMREGMSTIDVASGNRDDMKRFITDRMDKMEILSGDSTQVLSLRREILDNLSTQTHGDFINVGLLLHEISDKQRPSEIRDILSRSGGKRSDTIARKIEVLNATLSADDIADLNIILTWVIFACRPFSLAELESVLFFKTGEASLRPLAEKITDYYASILQIKGKPHPETKIISPYSDVALVSDSIKDFLREKPESDQSANPQNMDLSREISEAEIKIVRRFLEMICDPQLFSKFGFDNFLQQKLKGNTARVNIDADTAHLRILATCLEAMHSNASAKTSLLLDYAALYFVDHLKEADPSLAQPQHKMALGPQLVDVLTDEKNIKVWWKPESQWQRIDWIYDDSYCEAVTKWLQDSAVSKSLTEDQNKWVRNMSSKSALDADILEHVVRHAARIWLQQGQHLNGSFAVVHGYMAKIANRKDPKVERVTSDPRADTVEVSQILDAADWARRQFGLNSLGYEETRNLARTFREYGKHDKAIEYFKLASSLQEYNWLAQWGLATCYGYQKEWALAIETIEAVKNMIKAADDRADDRYLPNLDRDLARYIRERGDSGKALEIYEAILREHPDDSEASLGIILLYHKDGNPEGLLKYLETLRDSTDDQTGLNRMTRTFHLHCYNDEYHKALSSLCSDDKTFDAIYQSYQTAIAGAKEQIPKEVKAGDGYEVQYRAYQGTLMHNLAILCFENCSDNPERREFGIAQWESVLQMESQTYEYYLNVAKEQAHEKLAIAYFKEACRHPSEAPTLLQRLKELGSSKPKYLFSETTSYTTELTARYYLLQGDHQKVLDVLRPAVKHNMDMLSDDDPLNDWQGYQGLARTLMWAGHDADCQAAWSLIVPLDDATDAEAEAESPGVETPAAPFKGPMTCYCDGDCGITWTVPDDFYVCRECYDIQFDLRCLNKLREGSLKGRVCDKDHDMLYVPPYDAAERRRIGNGNVLVGEEIIPVNEWLRRIKAKWALE
ncbi:Tetratricopeptide-like helical [Penicillium sp. DV-2018c]|nr:Tetratricopeptide-like helical [Penicillium sp. DV-2018c]KAJ5576767.1 Tetratricopeptide-like helical [Penicillium sp. DV-2018c]